MGGWMEITGDPDRAPKAVGDNIGDSVPGVWTALSIVLALQSRHKSGKGQFVDMAMYDCMAAHMVIAMSHLEATGETTTRSRENVTNGEEKFKKLWKLLDRPDLAKDPHYLGKGINGNFYFSNILPEIEKWTVNKHRMEVTKTLTELGFSMGLVQDARDLYNCPQLKSRNMFATVNNTIGGKFTSIGSPIRLSSCENITHQEPPKLGLNTEDILATLGELSRADIESLKEKNLIS